MGKAAMLEFCGVSKAFGTRVILDNISFSIAIGEVFGLLGVSGSGKSTLTNILLGIHTPDSGRVLVQGVDVSRDQRIMRRIVGLTTQSNSFYEKLTAYENLSYYCHLYHLEMSAGQMHTRIMGLLADVELADSANALAENLSGGMKRRLDFAISLVHDPQLLILDEPTAGLDPLLVGQFWKLVRVMIKKGKTALVISHLFEEIKENCDSVGILHHGKLSCIRVGKDTDLYERFSRLVRSDD